MTLLKPEITALDDTSFQLFASGRNSEQWSAREIIGDGATELDEADTERAWILASTSYFAEQAGLVAAAELVSETDDVALRLSFATAVSDEARHADAFLAYAVARGGDLANVSEDGFLDELHETLSTVSHLEKFLMHTTFEGIAADEFVLLQRIFAGDPLGEIYRHVRSDEVRHVAIGLNYLRRSYATPEGREEWDAHFGDWSERALRIARLPEVAAGLGAVMGKPAEPIEQWFMRRHRARLRGAGIPVPERR
ncbi:ferritin-like domain-containing protein [Amycolatopsis sp. 195334CR]|uniref:ferritin-like domain-containing protein n=1 Tax=Amycolatopsis sp. 195334CR TaxID=2814588 RepID=UPI001A8ECBEA|nr:ferritin-like domain-containing protein [Amycolatopsis sp. 195334CR]MBN6041000.1 ferritin-like domain-containing protein [Amycolatopsis sp. 195334CR]